MTATAELSVKVDWELRAESGEKNNQIHNVKRRSVNSAAGDDVWIAKEFCFETFSLSLELSIVINNITRHRQKKKKVRKRINFWNKPVFGWLVGILRFFIFSSSYNHVEMTQKYQ